MSSIGDSNTRLVPRFHPKGWSPSVLSPRFHLRHVALSLVALGALTLAACGGASTTAKPTATATATKAPTATATPVLGKTFTSDNGVYSISYPNSWLAQSISNTDAPGAAAFSDSTAGDLVIVTPLNVLVQPSDYAAVAQSAASGANATDINLDPTTTNTTINNISWTEIDGTITLEGVPSEFSQLATVHNNTSFFLYLIAPTSTASTDATKYLVPMVQSLTFIK